MSQLLDINTLVSATSCREYLIRDGVGKFDKGYFSRLLKQGRIPSHKNPSSKRKIFIYEEVKNALLEMRDPTRDVQRKLNKVKRDDKKKVVENKKEVIKECATLMDEENIPKDSWATMSDEEKKRRDASILEAMEKAKEMSSEAENNARPDLDAGSSEWNTFKIMQQGLNYEIDRKIKEGRLMYLDDFKAVSEVILSPLNQSLDDLAFNFKAQFPDVADDAIAWLLDKTNSMKVDVQNVSV